MEQGPNNLSLEEKGDRKEPVLTIRPPPGPLSPVASVQNSPNLPPKLSLGETSTDEFPNPRKEDPIEQNSTMNESAPDIPDDDFGDFQAAG